MVKPGLGLMCFKCGDAHMQSECSWKGNCSVCGRPRHKDVVCRKNANGKIKWEKVTSSRGSVHMLNGTPTPYCQLLLIHRNSILLHLLEFIGCLHWPFYITSGLQRRQCRWSRFLLHKMWGLLLPVHLLGYTLYLLLSLERATMW